MVKIRKATVSDMPSVLDLIVELAVFEKEPKAVEVTVDDLVTDGFGKNPLFNVIVAENNTEIIGMALFYNRYSTWKGKSVHLEDLIVKEAYRGTGAGYKLYKEVIKTAFESGVKRVEWVVLDWNTKAVDFYKKSGADVLSEWNTVHMNKEQMRAFLQNNN